MRIGWEARSLALLALALLACPLLVAAEPVLSASLGFDHQLVRYRFAPLRVVVKGLPDPVVGSLTVRQFVGPDPAAPIVVEHEIFRGRIEDGLYETALPVCDPILPVLVQLLDDRGTVLASASESVRQSARGLPFRVIAGASYHIDDTEAIVDPSELPADWWAYDGVSNLWLASPLLSRAAWLALGAWVSAGGSLVLFSGSDFFQWDSPAARELLPFGDPSLRDVRAGIPLLTGRPRAGAHVLLTKDDLPFLVRFPYGAGHVSLVTARFRDLVDADLRRIEPWLLASRPLLSGDSLAEDLLDSTPVLRPMYAFAPLLVITVVGTLLLTQRRASRRPLSAVLFFVVAIGGAAAASGFYLNQLGRLAYIYSINTAIHMQTSVGLSTTSYAFYSLEPATMALVQEGGSFPKQVHAMPTARSVYAMRSEILSTELAVPARARRVLRTCDERGVGFRLAIDEGARTVRVAELDSRAPIAAMVFTEGHFHRFPLDQIGAAAALDRLARLSTSAMSPDETALYHAVQDWMPTQTGAWLLVLSETNLVSEVGEVPGKVRLVDLDIVRGVEE